MTTPNQPDKDAKVSPKDTAPSSETKRELTDGEIASVAGGVSTSPTPPHANPLPIPKVGPVTG